MRALEEALESGFTYLQAINFFIDIETFACVYFNLAYIDRLFPTLMDNRNTAFTVLVFVSLIHAELLLH